MGDRRDELHHGTKVGISIFIDNTIQKEIPLCPYNRVSTFFLLNHNSRPCTKQIGAISSANTAVYRASLKSFMLHGYLTIKKKRVITVLNSIFIVNVIEFVCFRRDCGGRGGIVGWEGDPSAPPLLLPLPSV